MKGIIVFVFRSVFNIFFTSCDPQLFGSIKRRKEKEKLAKQLSGYAEETQSEIDALKTVNPFESAAAKSAMAQSARKSKQMAQRYANIMGAGATPESIIASQAATQQGIGSTAGQIAVGAEAKQAAELARLQGLRESQRGQSIAAKQAAIAERGAGWRDFFGSIGQIGQAAEGVAAGASGISSLFSK